MIRLIAFDLIGVVFKERKIIKNVFMKFYPNADYNLVKKQYKLYSIGMISHDEFWKIISLSPKNEELFLKSMKLSVPISFFKDLMKRYTLAVISNLPKEWGYMSLKLNGLDDLFDYILISGKEKLWKPQREIYEKLVKISGIKAQEILFIDDKKIHLKGAKEVGMKTVWMKNEDNENFEPDFTINTLKELKGVLNAYKC